jgi:hypothetical protein
MEGPVVVAGAEEAAGSIAGLRAAVSRRQPGRRKERREFIPVNQQ